MGVGEPDGVGVTSGDVEFVWPPFPPGVVEDGTVPDGDGLGDDSGDVLLVGDGDGLGDGKGVGDGDAVGFGDGRGEGVSRGVGPGATPIFTGLLAPTVLIP